MAADSAEDFDRFVRMWVCAGTGPYPVQWRWAPNSGVLPDTERLVRLQGGEVFDRIGDERGSVLFVRDTPFAERALPPDRLAYQRRTYTVNGSHPDVMSGAVGARYATAGPWFAQPGGGTRVEFIDACSSGVLSVADLRLRGVLQ